MRHFNYKEVFAKFFPYYYKENDSYKDSEGRGLLERLITTCTEYFDTNLIINPLNPGLDNFIDLLDIDKTPEIFLNYLWEYLGEIPYAWGILTNGKPYNKDNLETWLSSPKSYPNADPRKALKYAISLHKIRGTKKFYQLLGKLYRVSFDFIDISLGISILKGEYVKATYEDIYSSYPSDLDPEGISSQYPLYNIYNDSLDCNDCVSLKVIVYISSTLYDELITSPEVNMDTLKLAFQRVIEKYLPIFCKINYIGNVADITLERSDSVIN